MRKPTEPDRTQTQSPSPPDIYILSENAAQLEETNAYPEGGTQAWLVVAGAWCAMIPSMGLLNTIGVLQAWMSEHQLQGYSESNIGWIVSAYAFFLYIGAAQIGLLTSLLNLLEELTIMEARYSMRMIYVGLLCLVVWVSWRR